MKIIFGRCRWFPRRKEHRRYGTARKIANWYTENINKTAVRMPMIYCKVWLNSFDSVYPLAAHTTLALRGPPMFSLFFFHLYHWFFPHPFVHSLRRCKVARCKTGNSERYERFLLQARYCSPLSSRCSLQSSLRRLLLRFILFDPREWKGMRTPEGRLGMISQSNLCIFSSMSIR